jgi:hypothetical protein
MSLNCPRCDKDVNEHPADRCLDAWVAEVVMGGAREHPQWYWWDGTNPDAKPLTDPTLFPGPKFSANIADVWRIVDWLQGEPEQFFFGIRRTPCIDGGWQVEFGGLLAGDENLCLAICRAALKAVTEER